MRAVLKLLASKTVLLGRFFDRLLTASGAKIEAGMLLPGPPIEAGKSRDATTGGASVVSGPTK